MERDAVYRIAVTTAVQHPHLVFRNPDILACEWRLQRAERDRFVRFFGSDLVVPPGDQAAVLRSSSGSARRRCWNPCQRSAGRRRPGRHHRRYGSTWIPTCWMPSPWR
jgi:hypothetical protein